MVWFGTFLIKNTLNYFYIVKKAFQIQPNAFVSFHLLNTEIMPARKKLVDPVLNVSSDKVNKASQEIKIDINSPELVRKKRVDPAKS